MSKISQGTSIRVVKRRHDWRN